MWYLQINFFWKEHFGPTLSQYSFKLFPKVIFCSSMKHFGSLIQRHESTLSHNKYLAKESVRLYGVMSFDQSRLQLLSKQIVVIIYYKRHVRLLTHLPGKYTQNFQQYLSSEHWDCSYLVLTRIFFYSCSITYLVFSQRACLVTMPTSSDSLMYFY